MGTQMHAHVKATPKPTFTLASTRLLKPDVSRQTEPASIPSKVHEVINSPGQPLDPATRSVMESRFGHNFGRVRVHSDAQAAESARTVNARAYTLGKDVVFGAVQYAPGTNEGRRLLAHELTHTIQQSKGQTA